jgi:peptidoglycan hydrolase CwlO-like protein
MTEPVPLPATTGPSADVKNSTRWARATATVERRPGAFLVVGVSVIALFLIAVSFWASNFNSAETWKTATYEARADRDAVQSDLANAESEIETLQATSDDLEKKVSTLEGEAAAVAQQAADLEEQAAEVAEREAAVSKTEDQIAANTISEGIWTVGSTSSQAPTGPRNRPTTATGRSTPRARTKTTSSRTKSLQAAFRR